MYLNKRPGHTLWEFKKLSCKTLRVHLLPRDIRKFVNLFCPIGNQDPAEDGLALAVELLKKVKKEKEYQVLFYSFFLLP